MSIFPKFHENPAIKNWERTEQVESSNVGQNPAEVSKNEGQPPEVADPRLYFQRAESDSFGFNKIPSVAEKSHTDPKSSSLRADLGAALLVEFLQHIRQCWHTDFLKLVADTSGWLINLKHPA